MRTVPDGAGSDGEGRERPGSEPGEERPAAPGAGTPGVHLPPPLLFAAGFAAGLGLQHLVPLPPFPPLVSGVTSAVLLVVGVGLLGWCFVLFLRARTTVLPMRASSRLVRRGPYRLTRNPMYVGVTALYLAAALLFDVAWALLTLVPTLGAVDRLVVRREERHLERRFGEAYREYRERVRRWL